MNMTKLEFRNLLCILHSIDAWELPQTWSEEIIKKFLRDPTSTFMRSDDERSNEIWSAMQVRAAPRDVPKWGHSDPLF